MAVVRERIQTTTAHVGMIVLKALIESCGIAAVLNMVMDACWEISSDLTSDNPDLADRWKECALEIGTINIDLEIA